MGICFDFLISVCGFQLNPHRFRLYLYPTKPSVGAASLLSQKTLGIKIAQKPYRVWSLGPKALIYESLEP